MLTKKTNFCHLSIALIALIGVSIQVSKWGVNMFLYFTTLSNTLVACYYFLISYRPNDTKLKSFKGSVVMAILLTGLVYHFMLASKVRDFHRLENYLVHYIVPLLVTIDFFTTKNLKLTVIHPLQWVVMPLVYLCFSLFNGLVLKLPIPNNSDSPFPYFFLNVTKLGITPVIMYVSVICIAYIVLGYVVIAAKKIVKR